MTLFVAVLTASALLITPSAGAAADPACTEGEACRGWAQMGNGQRQVVTVKGEAMVVGTCRFQKLWYAEHIRYDGPGARIERLKGDAWARRYGCGFDVQNY